MPEHTMTAARWNDRGEIALVRVPVPRPSEEEALIRVAFTGLCGSDIEEYVHGPVVAPGPVILGHEIVGVVAQAAADGSGPAIGARVVVDVVTGCGRCYWCLRHEEGRCDALVVTGQHVDGGLAQFVRARASRLLSIPDHVPMEAAVLAEPLAVAIRAVRRMPALVGRAVVVIGGGTIGMLVAQVARASGASSVVVIEPVAHRRRLIETWGIATLWDADPEKLQRAIRDQSTPNGVDVVAECSGRAGQAREAANLTKKGGTTVLLGVNASDHELDILDIVLGEKTVIGTAAHMFDDDVAVAVHWISDGRVDVASLVTHTSPLTQTRQAFETLVDNPMDVIKMIVDCRENELSDSGSVAKDNA